MQSKKMILSAASLLFVTMASTSVSAYTPPRTADILFSVNTDTLPASGATGNWASYYPSGATYNQMGGPTVQLRGTVKWERNVYGANQGFTIWGPQTGTYTVPLNVPADEPAAAQGATIVTAVKPTRSGDGGNWRSIVDVMYDQLVLGVMNDSGQICVRRQGNLVFSGSGITIPNNQNTVLSLVVAADGTWKVWANGTLIWTYTATTSVFTSLAKSGLNATAIGRNNYDGWTVFNGNIGDTFMYTVALSDTDRELLEADLMAKFHAGASYPAQTITASTSGAVGGGTITPSGAVSVPYEADQAFSITQNYGYSLDVIVDSVSQGEILAYTFTNVTAPHTITANYTAIPLRTISGNVSAKAGGGATVSIKLTGSSLPVQQITTDASGNYTGLVPEGAYYICASQTGYMISTDTVCNTSGDQTIDFTLTAGRNIPQMENLLFAAVTNQAAVGTSGNWPLLYSTFPSISQLTAIATPTVTKVRGIKYDYNLRTDGDGYRLNTVSQNTSIPVNGVTIVTLVKPVRNATSDGFNSVVDFFYSNLILGIKNNTGQIQVRRNGTDYWSANDAAHTIPDGQTTILSLVLAADGTFTVYGSAWNNTLETFDAPIVLLTSAATSAFTAFVPAQAAPDDYRKWINVGRNNPDGWSAFNGYIGEVFVYKTALPPADRTTLEADITMVVTNLPTFNITSTAGAGGSISPLGVTAVGETDNQTYTITPNLGYNVADVVVDGVTHLGAVTTYTFTAVSATHTIDATFVAKPMYLVSGQVTDASTGFPLANASVYFKEGTTSPATYQYLVAGTTDTNGLYSVSLYDGPYKVAASAAGYAVSPDVNLTVVDGPSDLDIGLNKNGKFVPQMNKLLFAAYADGIRPSDKNWELLYPYGLVKVPMGTIDLVTDVGQWYFNNNDPRYNGYNVLQLLAPEPCNGFTAMAMFKPIAHSGLDNNWQSVIDMCYSRFCLIVNRNTLRLRIRSNDRWADSVYLQDGVKYVLSVVTQPTGEYKVFTNGVEVLDVTSTSDWTKIQPGVNTGGSVGGYDSWITIGRNAPDGWSTCNGNIAAALVWKDVLSTTERETLEQDLLAKYRDGTFVVKALVAGEGLVPGAGSVTPASAVVSSGGSVSYTITRDKSKQIKSIRVNGALIPNMEGATAYTVENVTQDTTVEFLFKDSPAGLKILIY